MTQLNPFHSDKQHTLQHPVRCKGIGLHSGETVLMTLYPADADAGIVFVRGDLPTLSEIPARAGFVSETRLGTTLTNEEGVSISTVEHLMAALWGAGVDNARIMVEGPELPIMDGSSAPFIALIQEAGLIEQEASRRMIEVLEPMELKLGESYLKLRPYDGFAVDIEVEYNHPSIKKQMARYDFGKCRFDEALSSARTFGFAHEVEMMRQMGLARGGSLENAIVLGEDTVLNPEGLRFDDEFVRHKALDLVGDLFLAGYRLKGRVEAVKPGHQINTMMAQAMLDQPENWRFHVAKDSAQERVAMPVEYREIVFA